MKKTVSLLSAVLLLSLMLSICGVSSEAAGSLTIKYTRKDNGRGIAGVELSVFKVGDLIGDSYALTDDFQKSGVDLNSLTSAYANYKAAEALFRYSEKHGISGITAETDTDGSAYFGGLSVGVYLVAQTKDISDYWTISPYVIPIPTQDSNGTALYNVLSNVKTERKNNGGGGGGGGSGGGDNTFSASVTKIWDDSDDADGIRPQSVSVTLLKNGTKQKTAVLNTQNSWRHTFTGLSGSPTSYTVEESPIDGYTPSYSGSAAGGFVIINRHSAANPPKPDSDISVSVRKQWDDNNNEQGIRPKSVTVQLIKDGIVFRTAQLDESNSWSFRFDKLSDGNYTVKEITPDGYSASYTRTNGNLYTVTNTVGGTADEPPLTPANPSHTAISVKKVWNDNNNADGSRPDSITVDLIKDGEKFASAKLSEDGGWQHSFTDLPKDSVYSVYENTDGKYNVEYSGNSAEGYVITNTYPTDNPTNDEPEPTSPSAVDIPVEKIWRDGDDEGGIRPQSITVKLIKNGSIYRELELSEDGGWRGVFTDVPSDASYSIIEDAVQDYVAAYAQSGEMGFTITNTAVPGTTDIGVPPKPFVPAQRSGGGSFSASSPAAPAAAIPQTGNLNWPVPILAISGLIFIIIGLILLPDKRGEEQ